MTAGLAWVVEALTNQDRGPPRRVTRQEYQAWQSTVAWDLLQGLRLGQSFCQRFDIQDLWLYNMENSQQADRHIRRHYLKRNVRPTQ